MLLTKFSRGKFDKHLEPFGWGGAAAPLCPPFSYAIGPNLICECTIFGWGITGNLSDP